MKNYNLRPDEVVLYSGDVQIEKHRGSIELTLTNYSLIIINTVKKMFSKEQVNVETFPVEQIKVYNGVPQIKQKFMYVEIFMTCGEITIGFQSKKEASKFVDAAMQLLTGETTAERGANKVKGAIGLVDKTLGVNTVGAVKSVLENGVVGTILGGFGKKNASTKKEGSVAEEVVESAKKLLEDKPAQEAVAEAKEIATPTDAQLESLKKMKDLVDAGVLTQEEFEAKKKQILGL